MSMNRTIMTYAELQAWVDAFLKPDGLNLLFLVGSPGCAKSASIKAGLINEEHRYIKAGRLTAFQLYKQMYVCRGMAIILDDVEDAVKRSDTARMLMALCETDDAARKVAWFGSESLLTVRKQKKLVRIPQEFETTSRVCVVCNDWDILTSKFGALLDRGTVVFFDPAPEEIHRYVAQWFTDEEIYNFIGEHLSEISQHSIRYYVLAKEQKRHGLDWKSVLVESWTHEPARGNAIERLVRQLVDDPSFESENERIAAFTAASGQSRRNWFYLKKRLSLRRLSSCR